MSTIYFVEDMVEDLARRLDEEWSSVSASDLGLEPRASCHEMWASPEGIAVRGDTRSLNYYGGFEYVKDHCVTRFGDITIYSVESKRVRDHLYRFLNEDQARRLRAEYDEIDDEE